MKTLAVRSGDLVVGPVGHGVVTGENKTRQDLGIALLEQIGCDRFHPKWGSQLVQFIGLPIVAETQVRVQAETIRIVRNYMLVQADLLRQDRLANRRPRFEAREVIKDIRGVRVSPQLDHFHVLVELTMLSGSELNIATTAER